MDSHSRLIVALDDPNIESTRLLVKQLDPSLCRLKVGSILYAAHGPWFIEELMLLGFDVFLDLKFHDIPHTVSEACRVASSLGAWMLTVHISGGEAMMQAALDAVLGAEKPPIIIGVTVLTSMDQDDLSRQGVTGTVSDHVLRLAELACSVGLDGLVCSAQEASLLRQALGPDVLLVTPGIRLSATETQDQKRVVTPEDAIAAGADYLVVGRAITAAENPLQVLQHIVAILS